MAETMTYDPGTDTVTTQNSLTPDEQESLKVGEELEGQQEDVIGVFFNDQCIGWGFYNSGISSVPTTGDDGTMPSYPTNGDSITFKFYRFEMLHQRFKSHLFDKTSFLNL